MSQKSKMNILVIGSGGFIGSACSRILSADYAVAGADIHESDRENYFVIKGARSFDYIFRKHHADVCINASGSANVGFSFQDPEKDFELNVHNVQAMLEAIARYQPQCRFINFSSAAVYGNPSRLPIDESSSTQPLSPYGHHKLKSERLLSGFAKQGLKTCSLRVFSAYGPGLHKQLFWDIFQKRCVSKDVRLFGTGNETRDFIYIDDLAEAIRCVMHNSPFEGEAINVSSGIETTIRDAATLFLDSLNKEYTLSFTGEVKQGDPVNWRADITKLTSYGFKPVTDLQAGLRRTVTEYEIAVQH